LDDKQNAPASLTALDISGNLGSAPISANQMIPPGLTSLRAENVRWEGDNLRFFWGALARQQPQSKVFLSLSQAKMKESEWQRFFIGCPDLVSESLNTLHWVGNPVHAALFDYLVRSRTENLVLTGSLKSGDGSLSPFVDFLKNATALCDLTIAGTPEASLGLDDLKAILEVIKGNKSIERLNISNHSAGPGLLPIIGDALMINRRITTLKIDGNNMTDLDAYTKVFQLWQSRGTALGLAWPAQDVNAISSTHPSAAAALQHLRALYDGVVRGNSTIQVPPDVVERAAATAPVARLPTSPSSGPVRFNVPDPGRSKAVPAPEKGIIFTDVDPIDPRESAEYLLPLPPMRPLDNGFVCPLFDSEFGLPDLIATLRKQP
jgi:hypothetical protein